MWTLKKLWYRMVQFFLSLFEYLLPWRAPEQLTGPGCVKQLPALIRKRGISKVLVVTGPTLHRLGVLAPMLDACKAAGLEAVLFDGTENNPSVENVEAAAKLYTENACRGIIAFGGGSPIDCAKAVGARVVKPRQSVGQMRGTLRIRKKLPPLFAVPTTAGTGAETTAVAVITDRDTHHKMTIQDLCLIPCCAVLDPELTAGLPPHTTAITGIDTLTHAVEAYVNRFAPRYVRKLCEQTVRLVFENLETACADGANLTARQNMQRAAFFGGAAITRAAVGYVHAIAHTLGGLYGTPHGLANAVILPYVLEDYGPAVTRPLARLAETAGLAGGSDGERAAAFIDAVRALNKRLHIVDRFDFVEEGDVPQMIEWALDEANPLYPVPVIWNAEQLRRCIERFRA